MHQAILVPLAAQLPKLLIQQSQAMWYVFMTAKHFERGATPFNKRDIKSRSCHAHQTYLK